VLSENPTLAGREQSNAIMKAIGAAWKGLSADEQKEWNDRAEEINEANNVPSKKGSARSSQASDSESEGEAKRTNSRLEYIKAMKADEPEWAKDSKGFNERMKDEWNALSKDEKKVWAEKAAEVNKANGKGSKAASKETK